MPSDPEKTERPADDATEFLTSAPPDEGSTGEFIAPDAVEPLPTTAVLSNVAPAPAPPGGDATKFCSFPADKDSPAEASDATAAFAPGGPPAPPLPASLADGATGAYVSGVGRTAGRGDATEVTGATSIY